MGMSALYFVVTGEQQTKDWVHLFSLVFCICLSCSLYHAGAAIECTGLRFTGCAAAATFLWFFLCKRTKFLFPVFAPFFFSCLGIQFWVTEFLVSVLHFQKLSVVALSTFCFLTAPTSGWASPDAVQQQFLMLLLADGATAAACCCSSSSYCARVLQLLLRVVYISTSPDWTGGKVQQ